MRSTRTCKKELQEPPKLVTRLQEQVVRSLQTSFREGQISESVKSRSIVVCRLHVYKTVYMRTESTESIWDKMMHPEYRISMGQNDASRVWDKINQPEFGIKLTIHRS